MKLLSKTILLAMLLGIASVQASHPIWHLDEEKEEELAALPSLGMLHALTQRNQSGAQSAPLNPNTFMALTQSSSITPRRSRPNSIPTQNYELDEKHCSSFQLPRSAREARISPAGTLISNNSRNSQAYSPAPEARITPISFYADSASSTSRSTTPMHFRAGSVPSISRPEFSRSSNLRIAPSNHAVQAPIMATPQTPVSLPAPQNSPIDGRAHIENIPPFDLND